MHSNGHKSESSIIRPERKLHFRRLRSCFLLVFWSNLVPIVVVSFAANWNVAHNLVVSQIGYEAHFGRIAKFERTNKQTRREKRPLKRANKQIYKQTNQCELRSETTVRSDSGSSSFPLSRSGLLLEQVLYSHLLL